MDKSTKLTKAKVYSTTETPEEMAQDQALAKRMERTSDMKKKQKVFIASIGVVILLGLVTGYAGAVLSKPTVSLDTTATTTETGETAAAPTIKVGQVFGSQDAGAFKDDAEGVVLLGGVGGEGSHRLVRPGGESQNVYLTSSVLDLKMFENHKVKVYGETFKAQRAGWLMDVGRIEVKELNAPLPDWVKPQTVPAGGND